MYESEQSRARVLAHVDLEWVTIPELEASALLAPIGMHLHSLHISMSGAMYSNHFVASGLQFKPHVRVPSQGCVPRSTLTVCTRTHCARAAHSMPRWRPSCGPSSGEGPCSRGVT